jgi:hypothetical protein
MAQINTDGPAIAAAGRTVEAAPAASWSMLYRAAGAAALVTAVLIPVQLIVFMAYPFPDTVTGWFELLQDNPLAGLVNLDLLLVVDNVLLVVIALALYVALRRTSPSVVTMATGLWLLAIAMFVAANPAVEMLSLSDQFAAATSETERSMTLAAGQACSPPGRERPSRSATSWGSSPGSWSGWSCCAATALAGPSQPR